MDDDALIAAVAPDRLGCGHDPTDHIQRAQQRREEVDALMRRAAISDWAQIPAQS